jgi:hypothetical protein
MIWVVIYNEKPYNHEFEEVILGQKPTGLPTFQFSIILSLITQRVFIAKTCAWVRWKGYLLSKI